MCLCVKTSFLLKVSNPKLPINKRGHVQMLVFAVNQCFTIITWQCCQQQKCGLVSLADHWTLQTWVFYVSAHIRFCYKRKKHLSQPAVNSTCRHLFSCSKLFWTEYCSHWAFFCLHGWLVGVYMLSPDLVLRLPVQLLRVSWFHHTCNAFKSTKSAQQQNKTRSVWSQVWPTQWHQVRPVMPPPLPSPTASHISMFDY